MAGYRAELVAVDIETTGLSPEKDEIIELGAVYFREGKIVEEFSSLVRPRKKLPFAIVQLTGITEEMLSSAPRLEEVLPGFLDFVGDKFLLCHNAAFDLGFLEAALGRKISNPVLDTLELARLAFPLAKSFRLEYLAKWLQLPMGRMHRAVEDARITLALFEAVEAAMKRYDSFFLYRLQHAAYTVNPHLGSYLAYLAGSRAHSRIAESRTAEGSSEDNEAFADFAEGEAAVNDGLQDFGGVLPEAALEKIFLPGGVCAQVFTDYEYRPQQVAMLREVARAFNEEKCLLVEAGTGTGKSLAYLVPAIAWALSARERVAVSTHTITLQEQLLEQDIPIAQKILAAAAEPGGPLEFFLKPEQVTAFKVALLKGRNNYLCLRKWAAVEAEIRDFEPELQMFFLRLICWLKATASGDRSELNIGEGQHGWQMVASDAESCLGKQCRWHERCFFMRARRRAEKADLLVVNHALLAADIKAEKQLLPRFERLIVDEAHHLENVFCEHLGCEAKYRSSLEMLSSLYRFSAGGRTGILPSLLNRLRGTAGWNLLPEKNDWERELQCAEQAVKEAESAIKRLFTVLKEIAERWAPPDNGYLRRYFRLRPAHRNLEWWQDLQLALHELISRLEMMVFWLEKADSFLEKLEEMGGPPESSRWAADRCNIQSAVEWGKKMKEIFSFFLQMDKENWVYWVETEPRMGGFDCALKANPVEAADFLREHLFSPLRTAVLSSATLTVGESFEYYLERVGLNAKTLDRTLAALKLDSPFAYEEQVLLCVPGFLPNPADVSEEEYARAIAPALMEIITLIGGRTLVLFTSHRLLRETYFLLKAALEEKNITLLGHNIDGNFSRLLGEFKATPGAVVFGSYSFWEGIDVPGEELSCVAIVKLPFASPAFPIMEARMEAVANKQRSGFYHYLVPEAVLRFKQGFGRLIRTKNDRGVVIVFDRRIIEKRYGKKFLKSLPIYTHIRGEITEIKEYISKWLQIDNFPGY